MCSALNSTWFFSLFLYFHFHLRFSALAPLCLVRSKWFTECEMWNAKHDAKEKTRNRCYANGKHKIDLCRLIFILIPSYWFQYHLHITRHSKIERNSRIEMHTDWIHKTTTSGPPYALRSRLKQFSICLLSFAIIVVIHSNEDVLVWLSANALTLFHSIDWAQWFVVFRFKFRV